MAEGIALGRFNPAGGIFIAKNITSMRNDPDEAKKKEEGDISPWLEKATRRVEEFKRRMLEKQQQKNSLPA